MEYLNRLLKQAATHPLFRYHPSCKGLKLTCLAFADDILLFCKGHETSVLLLIQALTQFTEVSGLAANAQNSQVYVGGMQGERLRSICSLTGFQLGKFPMSYLGFPLSPRKWSKEDCARLVEQITARVRSWTTRHLSYAGRTLLIQSVLMSMHVY